jgi:hypothetical protein
MRLSTFCGLHRDTEQLLYTYGLLTTVVLEFRKGANTNADEIGADAASML